jgi:hypothetical protein
MVSSSAVAVDAVIPTPLDTNLPVRAHVAAPVAARARQRSRLSDLGQRPSPGEGVRLYLCLLRLAMTYPLGFESRYPLGYCPLRHSADRGVLT